MLKIKQPSGSLDSTKNSDPKRSFIDSLPQDKIKAAMLIEKIQAVSSSTTKNNQNNIIEKKSNLNFGSIECLSLSESIFFIPTNLTTSPISDTDLLSNFPFILSKHKTGILAEMQSMPSEISTSTMIPFNGNRKIVKTLPYLSNLDENFMVTKENLISLTGKKPIIFSNKIASGVNRSFILSYFLDTTFKDGKSLLSYFLDAEMQSQDNKTIYQSVKDYEIIAHESRIMAYMSDKNEYNHQGHDYFHFDKTAGCLYFGDAEKKSLTQLTLIDNNEDNNDIVKDFFRAYEVNQKITLSLRQSKQIGKLYNLTPFQHKQTTIGKFFSEQEINDAIDLLCPLPCQLLLDELVNKYSRDLLDIIVFIQNMRNNFSLREDISSFSNRYPDFIVNEVKTIIEQTDVLVDYKLYPDFSPTLETISRTLNWTAKNNLDHLQNISTPLSFLSAIHMASNKSENITTSICSLVDFLITMTTNLELSGFYNTASDAPNTDKWAINNNIINNNNNSIASDKVNPTNSKRKRDEFEEEEKKSSNANTFQIDWSKSGAHFDFGSLLKNKKQKLEDDSDLNTQPSNRPGFSKRQE